MRYVPPASAVSPAKKPLMTWDALCAFTFLAQLERESLPSGCLAHAIPFN